MSEAELKREDERLRGDFPIFADKELVYLDSSATTQKPKRVLDAVLDYYEKNNANPLRGLYGLSVAATEVYENARAAVRKFINAAAPEEIVFTRNATESLNLVAYSYGMNFLKPGDEILVSVMEHHSNLLPWQNVARATGAALKFVDCAPDGSLTAEAFAAALTPRTRLAAVRCCRQLRRGWQKVPKRPAVQCLNCWLLRN